MKPNPRSSFQVFNVPANRMGSGRTFDGPQADGKVTSPSALSITSGVSKQRTTGSLPYLVRMPCRQAPSCASWAALRSRKRFTHNFRVLAGDANERLRRARRSATTLLPLLERAL